VIWIDCDQGIAQFADWIHTLTGVLLSQLQKIGTSLSSIDPEVRVGIGARYQHAFEFILPETFGRA